VIKAFGELRGCYREIRVKYAASERKIVRLEALDAKTKRWEHVDLDPQRSSLSKIDIGVADEQIQGLIDSVLPEPAKLDCSVSGAEVLAAPELSCQR
jgi:hypothetical protein